MANRSLVENCGFSLQKLLGLLQSLFVNQGLDLLAAGEVQFGQLPDLEAPLRQSGEKGIVLLVIRVLCLSRVEQLGLALQSQDEAGLGQVAG